MDNNAIEKHIVCTASNAIEEICKPLKNIFKINYFSYIKTYHDKTFIRLSNHHQWTRYYFENDYYQLLAGKLISNPKEGYVLWPGLEKNQLMVDSAKYFDIDHGIILTENKLDGTELFTFASTPDNYAIINQYIENLDVLYNFIFYFREQAKEIIKEASLMKNRMLAHGKDKIVLESEVNNKKILYQAMPVKNYIFSVSDKKSISLSKREMECLSLFCQGLSAQQMADELYLSNRTVETHFINIKNKFNINNRQELLKYLKSYGFYDYIIKLKFF